MTYRVRGAFIASVGAVALLLAANETFARSATVAPRAGFASPHSRIAHSLRHHRRNNAGGFFYGPDGEFYGPNGEPAIEGAPPASGGGDVRYTYTYDVPWDWAHRFPPNVVPSDRPYVQSCPTEVVTLPGHGGKEQTVNITRCY
jgi:hypothetical protein